MIMNDFMSFSTLFQSYQDDGLVIMMASVQYQAVYHKIPKYIWTPEKLL